MKMMNGGRSQTLRTVMAVACAMAGGTANAEPLPVYEISESPGTWLQADLPKDIWRYTEDEEFRDMVLLDRDGGELPFRLVVPQARVRESSDRHAVPFFTVAAGAELAWGGPGNTRVHVDESSISVTRDEGSGEQPREFYLVDLSELEVDVDSLALGWEAEAASEYLHLEVSGSRDLQSWIPIAQHTLVRLEKDGQVLLRDEVPLGLRAGRYNFLRVDFPRDRSTPQLTTVKAVDKSAVVDEQPVERWELAGTLAADQSSASRFHSGDLVAWEFERQERAPVRQVSVALNDFAYGDFIRIYSRAERRHDWRLVHSGIWFNARVGSGWESSDPVDVYQNRHRYWRVEMSKALQGRGPALVFEHPRQRLRFVANDNEPYRVALTELRSGNPAAEVFTRVVGGEDHEWLPVSMSPLLSPEQAARRRTERPDWQGVVFWVAMVAAVALLLAFTVRLYRQMEPGNRSH
ncbi:DUF3999 family protein [Gilvimarinus sp. F26214L]|uniref:DUF3999 family protein n=1 Tax=Gilvimarinus sp. DZF01 TaxID=3461371 RepID=UPI00404683A5